MAETWNRYGPTAARSHGKPGREVRPSSLTLDVHSHVAVPAAAALVKPHLDLSTIPLAHFATPATKALNMQQDADRTSRMTLYDERLADLDAMGLDMQVIKPPPPQCYYTVPIEIAVKATRIINDGLAEYAAKKSDRFVAFGAVPLQDGKEAAAELERTVKQLGFKGVQILTNVAGKELSDPEFAPFWAKAEELGVLVVITRTASPRASA
jgi:aminocarboxymuconate-semialdehyde decarboxylase